MVGQHDLRVKVLASLDAILDGHCPFTGCDMNFEPRQLRTNFKKL